MLIYGHRVAGRRAARISISPGCLSRTLSARLRTSLGRSPETRLVTSLKKKLSSRTSRRTATRMRMTSL